MPYETKIYQRDELYAQVWARPVSAVAKDYGVSDVALAKVCTKLNIPRPSRGFWARKAAGHVDAPTPLPPLKAGQKAEHTVTRWVYPPPRERTPEEVAFDARPEFHPVPAEVPFSVEVLQTLERSHRVIARNRSGLRKAKPDREGLCWPSVDDALSIRVSPAQVDRTLRILDALMGAVERAGHRLVQGKDHRRLQQFEVDGELVQFRVRERLHRSDKPPSKIAAEWPSSNGLYLAPTGDLLLTIEFGEPLPTTIEFSDNPRRSLELQINDIFRVVLNAPPQMRAQRARRQAIEQLQRDEENRKRAIENARLEEKRWEQELLEEARRWEDAARLRRYVEAVRLRLVERDGEIQKGSNGEAWLWKAHGVAHKLDPLTTVIGPPP